jgi:hypothetical protein
MPGIRSDAPHVGRPLKVDGPTSATNHLDNDATVTTSREPNDSSLALSCSDSTVSLREAERAFQLCRNRTLRGG